MATRVNEHEIIRPDTEARLATLRDIVTPIFRHGRSGILVAVALCVATAGVVFAIPQHYDAEMTVLVKRERADTIVSGEAGTSIQPRPEVTEDELNSEVELLKNRDLLGQVAIASGLVGSTDKGDAGSATVAPAVVARAVRELASDLTITPLRKTTLIRVTYSSLDPNVAARVLRELARLYVEKHLALHRRAGAYEFFSTQTDRFRNELSDAAARLKEYGQREQVVSAPEEIDSTLRQLSEFEASLQLTRAQLADSTHRLRELENLAQSTPRRQTTQVRTSDNAQLMAQLRAKVLELELSRSEMLRKFTATYPPVVEIEGQLAQASAALEATQRTPLTEQTTDENPTHQWLESEFARVNVERAGAMARAEAIKASVEIYRAQARALEEKGSVQEELKRTIKNAEENYQLYLRKQEEARISDALDTTRISNVAIAEAPTVPALPTSSGRTLMLELGFLLACAAGLATVYLLDYWKPYFNTPAEVEAALGIPVLATLAARR